MQSPCANGCHGNFGQQLHDPTYQCFIGLIDSAEHLLIDLHHTGQDTGDGGNEKKLPDDFLNLLRRLCQKQPCQNLPAEQQDCTQHRADDQGQQQRSPDALPDPFRLFAPRFWDA